ncbi:MAG: hypothetical protein Q9190_001166 [Brigantiaea leucoxantha]
MYPDLAIAASFLFFLCDLISASPVHNRASISPLEQSDFVFPLPDFSSPNVTVISGPGGNAYIYYKIPGTRTGIGITPESGRHISREALHRTLENCQSAVKNSIRSHGDRPIAQDRAEPYIYPAPGTPHTGVGLEFRSESHKPEAGLRWSEVQNALLGLLAAYYQHGYSEEARFGIYEAIEGLPPIKEGFGRIFNQPRSVVPVKTTENPTGINIFRRSDAPPLNDTALEGAAGVVPPQNLYYKVPGTHTALIISPYRSLARVPMKTALEDCAAQVSLTIRREGDKTLASDRKDPYFYPDKRAPAHTDVRLEFRSLAATRGELKWSEVRATLLGIMAAMYNHGIYEEAYIEIFNEAGKYPRQEGEAWISKINPSEAAVPVSNTVDNPSDLVSRLATIGQRASAQRTYKYRVPGTNTVIGITRKLEHIPAIVMKNTLNNCRVSVENRIRREGDGPVAQGERKAYLYPARYTGAGVMVQSLSPELTWVELDNALIGLVAALYNRGFYEEASFVIYRNIHGMQREEGSGEIFNGEHEAALTETANSPSVGVGNKPPEIINIPPGTIFPVDEPAIRPIGEYGR